MVIALLRSIRQYIACRRVRVLMRLALTKVRHAGALQSK